MATGIGTGRHVVNDFAKRFDGNLFDFLTALLAAINEPAQAPALDQVLLWRDAPHVPLDAPWPGSGS